MLCQLTRRMRNIWGSCGRVDLGMVTGYFLIKWVCRTVAKECTLYSTGYFQVCYMYFPHIITCLCQLLLPARAGYYQLRSQCFALLFNSFNRSTITNTGSSRQIAQIDILTGKLQARQGEKGESGGEEGTTIKLFIDGRNMQAASGRQLTIVNK